MRHTRRHRLPQRLDYTLIPPPLDLSSPLVDEKSPLPAIIVTPSSPSGDRDFAIAFLAPPPKDSVFTRFFACLGDSVKARTALFILLLMFILACHLVTHRLAMRRPHLHFDTHTQAHLSGAGVDSYSEGGWFDLDDYWNAKRTPEFVVVESGI